MADLKLKILMEAVDKVTAPMRAIRTGATGLRAAVGETAEKLRGLERSAQQLNKFRELKTEARSNVQALEAAQARTQALAAAMRGADVVTGKMRREFAQATGEVRRLKEAQQRGGQELQTLRTQLHSAGVDTRHLASEQQRLRAAMAATTATAAQQAAALARVNARAKAMTTAKGKMEKTQAVAGSMAGAGAAGLATGGMGLGVIGQTANVGMDFEAMMSKVGALAKVDKTSEAFKKLEKQAFDLGATTSYSASQAAEAMGNYAMAGFDADKILAVMPSSLNLAKAGTTDLGLTSQITGNIMAGFGLQASQMGDAGDVLTATFTNSNTNLEMLGETMKYVAPIAKAAGYSLGDMSVLAGLLGNVGIQGSEAGTALRAAILRLASPPTEAKKALDALGVSTKDVLGNMRPMSSVLADLAEKTKKMGNAQKLEMFSKIFGAEAASAMTELVDQAGAKGIKDFAATVKDAKGLTDKIAAKMADNSKGDLDNLTSAIEGVQIILTKLNVQPLRDLLTWAAGVTTAFGEWMQANPELAATLSRIVTVVLAVIAAAGVLAITIAGILGPFAMLRFTLTALGLKTGPAIKGFFGLGRAILTGVVPALWSMATAAMANPIFWIVAAIAAAAAVLIIGWEPIKAFFADLWGKIKTAFSGFWGWVKGVLGFDPVAVLAPYWQPVATFLGGLWSGLIDVLSAHWERIKLVLGWTPLVLITQNWEPISTFLAALWDQLPAMLATTWEAIKAVFAWSPLGLVIENWQPISTFLSGLWDQLPAAASATWEAIKTVFAWSPLGLIIENWQPIGDFLGTLLDGAAAKINAVWTGIADKLSGIRGAVDWASGAWDKMFGDDKPAAPPAAVRGAEVPPLPIRTVPVPPPPAANVNAPPPANGNAQAAVHQSVSITVNAAPGMDAEAIAREVKRQLDQQAARARSAARSALSDR